MRPFLTIGLTIILSIGSSKAEQPPSGEVRSGKGPIEGHVTRTQGKFIEVDIGSDRGARKGDIVIILDRTGTKEVARRAIAFPHDKTSLIYAENLSVPSGHPVRVKGVEPKPLTPANSIDQARDNLGRLLDADAEIELHPEITPQGGASRRQSVKIQGTSLVGDLGVASIRVIDLDANHTPRNYPSYQLSSLKIRGLTYVFRDGLLVEESLLRSGAIRGVMIPILIKDAELKQVDKILGELRAHAKDRRAAGASSKGFVYNGPAGTPLAGVAKVIETAVGPSTVSVYGRGIVIKDFDAAIHAAEDKRAFLDREVSTFKSADRGQARGRTGAAPSGDRFDPTCIVLKIVGAALFDAVAREQDHNDTFIAALWSVGSRAARDQLVESAIWEGFPDLPGPAIRAARRLLCSYLDGKLTLKDLAADSAKEEIIAALENEDASLGKAPKVADLIHKVLEQYSGIRRLQ